ncbi:unnamed protein product [Protopolystoma xenopodis]|uniref:Secreted protein n=1 Tax=Protopolystoma xenopodis TaxID=117903 RepID=A0A3S5CT52_9PLAT|nr:unnamed protein product [Protopolystoma xenopodis]
MQFISALALSLASRRASFRLSSVCLSVCLSGCTTWQVEASVSTHPKHRPRVSVSVRSAVAGPFCLFAHASADCRPGRSVCLSTRVRRLLFLSPSGRARRSRALCCRPSGWVGLSATPARPLGRGGQVSCGRGEMDTPANGQRASSDGQPDGRQVRGDVDRGGQSDEPRRSFHSPAHARRAG